MLKNSQSLFVAVAVSAVLAISSASWASIIFTGAGWQISVADQFADAVSVTQETVVGAGSILTIHIIKDFNLPVGQFGEMSSILMNFQQVAPDDLTASKIVIDDEQVNNNTGATWTDFHWILIQSGFASFNQDETYPATHAGFSTDPFVTHEWSSAIGSQELSVAGGTLPSGSSFSPGATSGELVIDVNLAADGDQAGGRFTLKEIPTIPEPMTLSLLAIGGLYMAMRRKS
jgi:hypothetical protein